MKRFEQAFNIGWVLLSMGICAESIRLGLWGQAGPGSGLIPFVSGMFVGLIGIALFVLGWSKSSSTKAGAKFWADPHAGMRVAYLLIGLCAMAFIMPKLGFFLTAFMVTSFMLYVIEPQRWWEVLATSFASCAAVYLLFGYLLDIRLPVGFLGI